MTDLSDATTAVERLWPDDDHSLLVYRSLPDPTVTCRVYADTGGWEILDRSLDAEYTLRDPWDRAPRWVRDMRSGPYARRTGTRNPVNGLMSDHACAVTAAQAIREYLARREATRPATTSG